MDECSLPMPHGTLICQTENSDNCNQTEMAFKSALYWKKKALPNPCLLTGSSFSLPLRFFSISAKASSLTFMSEFCREGTKKIEKKGASQLIPPSYFSPLYAAGTTCLEKLWKSTHQFTSDDWGGRRSVPMSLPFFSLYFLEHLQWDAGLIHSEK